MKLILSESRAEKSDKSNPDKIDPENMRILEGVRVFSMCWVILGHTYLYNLLPNGVIANTPQNMY